MTSISSFSPLSTRLSVLMPVSSRRGRITKRVATTGIGLYASISTSTISISGTAGQTPVTSSSSNKKIPPNFYHRPYITTLRPERMAMLQQKTTALTSTERIYFKTIFRGRALSVGPLRPTTSDPSVEQRGVLYYYQDPSLSELAGEVRFRYCNDVSEFDKGEDHKDSPIRTWRIPLHDIARFERHMPLRQLLIADELVSEDVMDDLADLTALREGAWLYSLDQPFLFELSKPNLKVTFVTRRSAAPCCFESLHRESRIRVMKQRPVAVYSGTIRARWELSTLPEHQKDPRLLMRVLETLTPIKCLLPEYDGWLKAPKAGEPLSRKAKDHSGYDTWFYPLKRRVHGKGILDFIKRTEPEKVTWN